MANYNDACQNCFGPKALKNPELGANGLLRIVILPEATMNRP